MDEWTIRRVGADDVAIVAQHRLRMFQDMGEVPTELACQL